MFPSTNASSLAPTMDLLEPWMIAALAGLALLMLILIIVAVRKSRAAKAEESLRISKGGEAAQTARSSQVERQGTRSARGEASKTADDVQNQPRVDEQQTARIATVGAAAAAQEAGDVNDEIMKRAAERKKARGSSREKGSHAK